jgi:cation:H+ antiporter
MIVLFLALGVLLLPLGANLMLEGAVALAARLGVSNAVIGLTVMALGTSLPELSTTLVAAIQRHSDLALGNVIGSNLFNILAIMGIAAIVAPGGIPVPPSFLRFDLLVMLAATGILAWFAWRRSSIGLGYGLALLSGYTLYVFVLFGAPDVRIPLLGIR